MFMQIGQINARQLMGIDRGLQTPPSNASSPAARESFGASALGPAYVREQAQASDESFPMYTTSGSLRGESGSSGDEARIDARAVKALEERDREVTQREEGKGEAVGGRGYVYQTGPDGKRYAIGTAPHVVEEEANGENAEATASSGNGAEAADGTEAGESEQEMLRKLQQRDAKVRGHEAAHVMAAGGQASMPTYNYQTGPDGRRYAVGGSVNISMISTGDSEQTARQAQKAYRAAMATGEPSSADMQAATRAMARAAEAKQDEPNTLNKDTHSQNPVERDLAAYEWNLGAT